MPASFSSLPFETMNQIISNVGKSGSLLNIALTCHSVYDIALPHLYADVRLQQHRQSRGSRSPRLWSFTFHVLHNPQLAAYVRAFTLQNRRSSQEDPCDASEPLEVISHQVIKAVHRYSHTKEEATQWIDDLKKGYDDDAILAALLPSLPNLERLQLLIPEIFWYGGYFSKIFTVSIPDQANPFDRKPALSSLRIVIIDCDSLAPGTPLDLLADILKLPSLREFYSRKIGISHDGDDESLTQLAPNSSKLTHLELRDSRLDASDVTTVLRVCSGLKTFVCELGWHQAGYFEYSIPALRRALDLVAGTLEDLWLDYTPGPAYWSGVDDCSPIPSLAIFQGLKNLKVGFYVLFGDANTATYEDSLDNTEIHIDELEMVQLADVLPVSLETIYISHTNGKVKMLTRALELLLEQKQSAVPQLQQITFEAYITCNDESFDFSRLDQLAEENSVIVRRIDGTALVTDEPPRWRYSPGISDRGQGMDGSLTWAAEYAPIIDKGAASAPVYIRTPN